MNKNLSIVFLFLILSGCRKNVEKTHPVIENISESVYASGILKSKNQYQVFANANGIISDIFVTEGDTVKKGSPILSISNETSKLNTENAQLAAKFSDYNSNIGKLNELNENISVSKSRMINDSLLFERQKTLWSEQIGSRLELEQRDLAYQSSKSLYVTAKLNYNDLKKQISFSSEQSKNNLQISKKLENDFTVKSEIDGKKGSERKEEIKKY